RYSRMLLQFAHAVTRRHQRVETFLFSTRLTRVTRELRLSGPDDALASVSRAVTDWSGGTRIGQAVREFHQRWSRRVLHRGPVVLLISDGWDRGDPVELGEQIARLQRSCHRLVGGDPVGGPTARAQRHTRPRAPDARAAGGAAVRGRFPPGAHVEQSRGPGDTLERPGITA